MRKIKDIKDSISGELVYPKCHAKATYLSDGRSVEDAEKTLSNRLDDFDNTIFIEIEDAVQRGKELALRELYIAAGAEYNNTDQIIQKTAPWEKEEKWELKEDGTYHYWEETATVDHLPGHYYLNGLGDITEEQMLAIYDAGTVRNNTSSFYAHNKNIRTFLPSKTSGQEGYGGVTLSGLLSNATSIESAVFTNRYSVAERYGCAFTTGSIYAAFSGCSNLKYIQKMAFTSFTNTNEVFKNCKSLVYVKMNKLKCDLSWADSSMISKGSVLYTIQNAAPTTAITITLHPDAYTRLAEDADIVAALEEKNAALIAEGIGGSISLVSA